jgi:2-amino-4-ketopentanoate thiolase alpha subunit
MIKKGTWVEVEEVVLTPEERSSAIPEETKKTPLKVWVRGNCMKDCSIGEEVEVATLTGRILKGVVVEEKPAYRYGFGEYIEEIQFIGRQAREILFYEGSDELE